MNKLTVILNAQGWHVRFEEGHYERQTIVDLFETDTIPLPWTSQANASQVIASLRKSYPGSNIAIKPSYSWIEVPGEVA